MRSFAYDLNLCIQIFYGPNVNAKKKEKKREDL
jgi:hypothetical protein